MGKYGGRCDIPGKDQDVLFVLLEMICGGPGTLCGGQTRGFTSRLIGTDGARRTLLNVGT